MVHSLNWYTGWFWKLQKTHWYTHLQWVTSIYYIYIYYIYEHTYLRTLPREGFLGKVLNRGVWLVLNLYIFTMFRTTLCWHACGLVKTLYLHTRQSYRVKKILRKKTFSYRKTFSKKMFWKKSGKFWTFSESKIFEIEKFEKSKI